MDVERDFNDSNWLDEYEFIIECWVVLIIVQFTECIGSMQRH